VQALLEIAKIERRPVRASQISFGLGPRINAAGRLGHADAAVELLLSANLQQARDRAAELEELNDERRRIESRIREEALRMVETSPGLLEDAVLVLADPGWHPGVIGIVAAKVAERFGRPALLVATGTEPAKGSARSVPEIDLYARLARCGELFTSLGGHAQAAGFSIHREDLPRLRREINRDSSGSAHPAPAPRRIDVDALVRFKDLDASLSGELRRLAPFGQHNPEPAFATSGVLLAQPPRSVGNNHLRLSLVEKTREPARIALHRKSFIGFNLGAAAGELADGMRVDVVYDLDLEGGANGSWERYRLRDVAASEAP
jgi:single-stranded-DNA-specific exonuclease